MNRRLSREDSDRALAGIVERIAARDELGWLAPSEEWMCLGDPLPDFLQPVADRLADEGRIPDLRALSAAGGTGDPIAIYTLASDLVMVEPVQAEPTSVGASAGTSNDDAESVGVQAEPRRGQLSDNDVRRLLIAEHGPCVCTPGDCPEDENDCDPCSAMDIYWPCFHDPENPWPPAEVIEQAPAGQDGDHD
jgi:hypothetical protein